MCFSAVYGKSKMEQNNKSLTKQLAIAVLVLILVTILSFGIRCIRFSALRANSIESSIIANIEDQSQQLFYANTELDHYPDELYTVDNEPEPEYDNTPDWYKQDLSDDYSEEYIDLGKYNKTVSLTKGDYDKSEGAKDLQRIPLSNYEDLYINEKGELWYVIEYPDGSVTKNQMQIYYTTGEISVVEDQGSQRIPLSYYEDLYITGDDELWYVIERSDGTTAKMQMQVDQTTGQIAVVDFFVPD